MSYHVDRFFAALSVLAGHGHIKQRLIRAYEDNLAEISEDELPVTAKQTFADLKQQMYRVSPLNGEGPICASVRKMSVNEASECAAMVVALYGEVLRCQDPGDTVIPLDGEQRASVPPFLVKSN